MKYEALEDFGKFKKGDSFESEKSVFSGMVKKGILKKLEPKKAKVEHTKREKKVESGFFNRKKK